MVGRNAIRQKAPGGFRLRHVNAPLKKQLPENAIEVFVLGRLPHGMAKPLQVWQWVRLQLP
jgi:hypothetical protein